MAQLTRILFIAGVLLTAVQAAAQTKPETLQLRLQTMLTSEQSPLWNQKSHAGLHHLTELKRFYARLNYRLAWPASPPENQMDSGLPASLKEALQIAADHGLNPSDSRYHLKTPMDGLAATPPAERQIIRDLLMSDTLMSLGYHLLQGRVYPLSAGKLFHEVKQPPPDLPELLAEALENGSLSHALESLAPNHRAYQNLKKSLKRYQAITDAGGWNEAPDRYRDIEEVKHRLALTGDYTETPAQHNKTPTNVLIAAIKTFQQRHHLKADGVVGAQTRLALARSVEEKLAKIRLNLERWRWFTLSPQNTYLEINVPDFSLHYNHGQNQLSMKVVVGQKSRQTPMMEARMDYLVFNPYWRIPKTILEKDILPKLKTNPDYLNEKQIRLFKRTDSGKNRLVAPETINWEALPKEEIHHYLFRQDPGFKNPLGKVKFIFPNSQDIYLHATPTLHHFEKNTRIVSSGCIRAEKPMELAHQILTNEPTERDELEIKSLLSTKQHRVIWLKQKIPVFVTYQTAWADDKGQLFLREDIYGLDQTLQAFFDFHSTPEF